MTDDYDGGIFTDIILVSALIGFAIYLLYKLNRDGLLF